MVRKKMHRQDDGVEDGDADQSEKCLTSREGGVVLVEVCHVRMSRRDGWRADADGHEVGLCLPRGWLVIARTSREDVGSSRRA